MIARIIATCIFGGFGIVLFVVGIRNFLQQRKFLRDPRTVDAIITVHEVSKGSVGKHNPGELRDGTTNSYTPVVKFKYTINGKEYESDLIRPSEIAIGSASSEGAEEQIKAYPLGATVKAYYQPDMPDKAFLSTESSSGPMVFIILGLLLGPLVWFVGKWIF